MDKINTEAALEEVILLLEMRQANEVKLLKEEFQDTYEKLQPVNLVKNIFQQTAPLIRNSLLNKIIDMGLIFLTNVIIKKTTNSIVKRTIGTALVFGIKNILSQNPQFIKAVRTGILKIIGNIITKRNKNREHTYN